MNQKELIEAVMEASRDGGVFLMKKDAKTVVEAMSWIIFSQIAVGNEVKIPLVGKLKPRKLRPRKGMNPTTGEKIDIAAKYRVKFLASAELTRALAENQ